METTVLQRIGNVLYWAGCASAGLFALGVLAIAAAYVGAFGGITNSADAIFFAVSCAVFAFLSWLAGRTCKYILGGK